ncbi:MAG: hypothetical protein ABJ000_08405 [Saccharospirillum sp.]|uniref:hypothetical protein n=1 Tax=Saccharospirillum sp. TaxID=2033801 RepID=UPI0032971550
MKNRYVKFLVESAAYTLGLLLIGAAVWFWLKDSGITYQDVLFWIAIAPIGLFCLSLFGRVASGESAEYQISKTTINGSGISKSADELRDEDAAFGTLVKLLVPGVMTLLISMLM